MWCCCCFVVVVEESVVVPEVPWSWRCVGWVYYFPLKWKICTQFSPLEMMWKYFHKNLHKWKLICISGNWFPFVQIDFHRVEIDFHLCKSISTQRTRHFSIQRMSHYKLNGYEYRFAFSTAVSFLVISPNIVSATSVTLTCHTGPVTSGILQDRYQGFIHPTRESLELYPPNLPIPPLQISA